jgi:hypothetical protein
MTANPKIVGADVFVNHKALPLFPEPFGKLILTSISNRGSKVWPGAKPRGELVDVHQCRFERTSKDVEVQRTDVLELLKKLEGLGVAWVHVELLLEINGKPGFSRGE